MVPEAWETQSPSDWDSFHLGVPSSTEVLPLFTEKTLFTTIVYTFLLTGDKKEEVEGKWSDVEIIHIISSTHISSDSIQSHGIPHWKQGRL